jgi:hypothetical protein
VYNICVQWYTILMDFLLRSDILFFLASLGVFLVVAGILAVIYYMIKILRDVESIAESVKQETKEIVSDIEQARSFIKRGVLPALFMRIVKRWRRGHTKKQT